MTDQGFTDSIAAHQIQLEMAPHLTPHLNFLPYKIYLPRETIIFTRLDWNGDWEEIKTNHHDAFYQKNDKFIIGGDWLAPGQMMVYRYE